VASNYLLSAHEHNKTYDLSGPRGVLKGGKVYINLRKSKFRLPQRIETPVIMIGAGTGIAPFRGFIMERAQQGQKIGSMKLFFGCRNDKEFLYKAELMKLKEEMGDKLDIITAFSREGDKVYVQERIKEKAKEVAEMILEGANVYICGGAGMARDVEVAIVDCLKSVKGDDAQKFVKENLKKTRRLQEDVW
jgi:NADPH-ferrihemoprotein reductase